MTDIVHVDGIADAHSQTGQDILFDLRFRYGADRNRCRYLVDVRFQFIISDSFTVRQGYVLTGLDDCHGISGNRSIELHITGPAHVSHFFTGNLRCRIDGFGIPGFFGLTSCFFCFLLDSFGALTGRNRGQLFFRFIARQAGFSSLDRFFFGLIIRRSYDCVDSSFLIIISWCRCRP